MNIWWGNDNHLGRRKDGGAYRCAQCEERGSGAAKDTYQTLAHPTYDHLAEMDDDSPRLCRRHWPAVGLDFTSEPQPPVGNPVVVGAASADAKLSPPERSLRVASRLAEVFAKGAGDPATAVEAIAEALAEIGVTTGNSLNRVTISATPDDYAWLYPILSPLPDQAEATDPARLSDQVSPAGLWQDMEVRTGMLVTATRLGYNDPEELESRSELDLNLPTGGSRPIAWQTHNWARS